MSRIMWVHPDGRRWDRTLPPRKVGTLGDQVRSGHALTLFCLACARSTRLQPAAVCALAAKHGGDLQLRDFLDRLVCQACDARWPWLDLHVSPYLVALGGGRAIERVAE